ncbi:hypothetical protein F5878DRAFT_638129 [Lentinula raphanica]|uniref:Uncharacterized protein n=1 Tax=Lentinula raphanica TaxID=153919 RepID=A0AA38PI57_9AGAR|nr:hypothetical protein F5878DRAFT_638129 [Lentinula raphanica]
MQIPLLLRSTPSIQNPQRKHVTHGTPEICDLLKTMDLQSRLEANKEIDTENRRRRKQELAHLRDPSKPMPSPRASLITITSEEYEEIRTTPSRLQAFASLLLDPVRKFFAEKDVYEKSLKRLREEPKEDEEERLRKRRVADRLIYKEYDPLAPIRVEIHQVLYEIAHISLIPLPFFANQNLEFIAANSHSLPRKKIKSDKNPQGGHLLDLEALAKTLEIDLCESDKMEGLDFILFTECANNMIAFETERDPDGATGTRAQLFIKHFAFFLNKREAPKWFNHWKPTEFKLRKNQYLVPTGFVSSVYTAEWSKVELKAELAESFPTFDSSIQFPSGPACPPTPSFRAVEEETLHLTASAAAREVTYCPNTSTQSTACFPGHKLSTEHYAHQTVQQRRSAFLGISLVLAATANLLTSARSAEVTTILHLRENVADSLPNLNTAMWFLLPQAPTTKDPTSTA